MKFSLSRALCSGLMLSLITACGSNFEISFDVGSSYDFGPVNLTKSSTKEFILTNSSDKDVKLEEVSSVSLGLSGDLALTGGTCETGMELAVQESCSLEVTYTPTGLTSSTQTLKIKYIDPSRKKNDNPDKKKVLTNNLVLSGRGDLDCTVDTELLAQFDLGAADAITTNNQNTARGTADGEALTVEDGERDGYDDGYAQGYNRGYNSPQGYDAGYSVGFDIGYSRGVNSLSACNSGTSAGRRRGEDLAEDDGDEYGYPAGYDAGYELEYPLAYDDGYWDGDFECNESKEGAPKLEVLKMASNQKELSQMDESLDLTEHLQACYDKGFGSEIDLDAYENAYEAAKAANVEYQGGYADKFPLGDAQGEVDGIKAGYADGRARGEQVGEERGEDDRYDDCYADGLEDAYDDWYSYYFDLAYDRGFDDGESDAAREGYDEGYSDGCGGWSYNPAKELEAANNGAKEESSVKKAPYVEDNLTNSSYENIPPERLSSIQSLLKTYRTFGTKKFAERNLRKKLKAKRKKLRLRKSKAKKQ